MSRSVKTQTDRTDRQIEVASTIKTAAYDAARNSLSVRTHRTYTEIYWVCAQCNAGLRTDPSSDAPTIKVKSDSAEVWLHAIGCHHAWIEDHPPGEK